MDLVRDFMAEFIDQPCVLVGNSVGSLVVLTVRAPCAAYPPHWLSAAPQPCTA